jgi:hypothetical protein
VTDDAGPRNFLTKAWEVARRVSKESTELMAVAYLMGVRASGQYMPEDAVGPPVARSKDISIYRLSDAAWGGEPEPPRWVSFVSGRPGVGWIRRPTIRQALGAVMLLEMIDRAEGRTKWARLPESPA